jgi:hypothetical protein
VPGPQSFSRKASNPKPTIFPTSSSNIQSERNKIVSASVLFNGISSKKHSTGTPSSSQLQNTDYTGYICTLICYEAEPWCPLNTLQNWLLHPYNDPTTATLCVHSISWCRF